MVSTNSITVDEPETVALVRRMLRQGIFCQNKIFAAIYPTYTGHYWTLRNIIAQEKEKGID